MKFEGLNNALFECQWLGPTNKYLVEQSNPGELLILWFYANDNQLIIDNMEYSFCKETLICFTEFNKVKVKEISKALLIRWNKNFYCVVDHDREVSCKGVLFYGATTVPIIQPNKKDAKTIHLIWKQLEQEFKHRTDEFHELMLEMCLQSLLIVCIRCFNHESELRNANPENQDLIREYHYLVELYFKEKNTVAEFATLLNKAPKTLSNLFKKLGIKPPLQFIKDRKILEAKRLLTHTDLQVSEIGYEIGFSEVQSFSRFFKRETGVSPLQYKEEKMIIYGEK